MPGDDFLPHPKLIGFAKRHNNFFYYRAGKGESLLLLHGNGDEADTWRHVFVPLAEHFDVIAPDLPGFGRTPTTGDGTTVGIAHALKKFMNDLQIKNCFLLGSSMGAIVAAQLAMLLGAEAKKLVIMAGAAPNLGGFDGGPSIAALVAQNGENFYNDLRLTDEQTAFDSLLPYYANLKGFVQQEKDFLRARVWARVWSDTQRDAFFQALRSMFAAVSQENPSLEKYLQLPCLLVWGENDRIVPVSACQFHFVEKILIPHCGHLPQQEQPEILINSIKKFLGAA